MTKIYYFDGVNDIIVGKITTNQSLTIDEMLDLIEFDEQVFLEEQGFDEIDYNDFYIENISQIQSDMCKHASENIRKNAPWILS